MINHRALKTVSSMVVLLAATVALGQEAIPSSPNPFKVGSEYTPPPAIPAWPDSAKNIDTSAAQTVATSYSLDDVLRLASTNNPTIVQAQVHISAELGKALAAGLYPNPIFSYEADQIFVDSDTQKNTPGEFQGGFRTAVCYRWKTTTQSAEILTTCPSR